MQSAAREICGEREPRFDGPERLDCRACGGSETMFRDRVPRFSLGLRIVGTMILIVCAGVSAAAAYLLLALGLIYETSPGMVGATAVVPLSSIGISLIVASLGWVLCSSRRVWLCEWCRCWVERD